ncbi:non-ribosomal peptide synthetase [Pedobacter gandavensis]|uniref:Amino acid adenylation domain-containing protein n=1 Tax=Pedobacter gandavensis TaxID=2679963 RepID=A0ABR6ET45_9SPHI|nr:non-ribosomal peptide synthetase [Pedobacter gandavensis]MBB2148391.1 amino acid adenylation domain-containing protein [Pedobacter gandavensis]
MSQHILTPVDFDPFEETKEIEKIVFTNEPQKEIWLSCMIGGLAANLAYNESVSLELKGEIQFAHFATALLDVLDRHEALRATVSPNGESLIIYNEQDIALDFQDISREIDQKAMLNAFIKQEMQSPFDLQEGPLMRLFLHKLSETHYFFTIVKHHIISDGWSTGVFLEDLCTIYNANVQGKPISLSPAPQISDYAHDMMVFEQSPEYRKTLDYWLDMYKDHVPVLNLPTDFPRPALRTYEASRFDLHLSTEIVTQLKKTGASSGASLVNTLLSAFEVFLYLQTHQEELVVGLPAAGQAATEKFGLIGHCVNLLPLKTKIDPNLSFSTYLKQRKKAFFDAYDHQKFTFGQLVKALNLKRDPSRIPLVPVVFNIDMGMDNSVSFDGLDYELISNPRAYETFELFLNATSSKRGLTLEWTYNTQLFSAATIEKMAGDFESLLKSIIEDPTKTISAHSVANSEPWLDQLKAWNQTAVDFDKNTPLTQLIEDVSLKQPNQKAISFRKEQLTYRELNYRVNQFATYLQEKGIKTGDIVAIATERSIEMVIGLLGILKAGGVYLPLDPDFPHDRIVYMLADSKAKILLVSKAHQGKYTGEAVELVIEEIWTLLDDRPAKRPEVAVLGSNLAYILYTSGSTGKPKGVKITHANLLNFLFSMQSKPGIDPSDRLLAITTISFDIAGLELYLPLITGAELVLCDTENARDGRLLLDLIQEQQITIMQATPSTWRMMIESGWTNNLSLKVLCGGESLPKDLATALLQRCSSLWNMYGPTETTIWSTIKEVKKEDELITIGKPIFNTSIYLLNENGQLVPPGNIGEIVIGGEGLAEGYLNQPELTAEKFIKDTFSGLENSRLYKTGDLGKFTEDGEIICLGRSDQQVKIRGHRIELGEIENCIAELEAVKQAVVIATADQSTGQRLVAYVIPEDLEQKNTTPSWKDRWDTIYDMAAQSSSGKEESEQKIDGILLEQWKNSDSLVEQAAEWLKVSAERIKALHAQDILEIGSGGGQLMFELAPFASSYLATDYAETAIEKLQEKLDTHPEKWQHVKTSANAADDFSKITNPAFDLILIHSVAQYFPDTAYFLKVIGNAVQRLKNGGCLFIGDMQGKNSLTMYHAMDYLANAKDSSTLPDFQEVVSNRVRIEDEFVADPTFFYLLPKLMPEISGVDVQLRRGSSLNETTKYHYDVWIYVNSDHKSIKPDITLDWQQLKSVAAVADLIKKEAANCIAINGVFNSRTARDYALLQWMSHAEPTALVADIKQQLAHLEDGVHPDQFWDLGKEMGYQTHIRWGNDGTDGNYDVIFIKDGIANVIPEAPSIGVDMTTANPLDFAKTPISTNEVFLSKKTIAAWKEVLSHALPDYMVPADFIALKMFPLTPNHKIDKKALPKPQPKAENQWQSRELPQNKDEQLIFDIWSAVLGLEYMDTTADFFELGGHSLLAVKVMAAIEKETGKRLPLATLFENANIQKLAKKLRPDEEEVKWEALVPIKTSGSKHPLFMVHGGGLNVLVFQSISKYLDEDQPLYGLQALGLNRETVLYNSIEEIAAVYVSEIMKVHPNGPYYLSGYSLGGFIVYEMAKQLTKMGKEVKFLGILDTYAGDVGSSVPESVKVLNKIKRQFYKVPFIIGSLFRHPGETIHYQRQIIKRRMDQTLTPQGQEYTMHFSPYEKEIYKSYDQAHNHYTMVPEDLKISLFTVKKRLYYLDDNHSLGWAKYANKGIERHHVPGDHETFLYPPNNEEFARILQAALNNI